METLIKNTDTQLEELYKELSKLNSQKSKLYDFLEQGIYDNNVFIERSNILAKKISDILSKIEETSIASSLLLVSAYAIYLIIKNKKRLFLS